MADDGRVCGAAPDIQRCLRRELLTVETGRPDPSVAIPFSLAVPDRDAVNHAVAEKPVSRFALARVGAVSGIKVAKLWRNAPFHGQIERRRLFPHRFVIASHPYRGFGFILHPHGLLSGKVTCRKAHGQNTNTSTTSGSVTVLRTGYPNRCLDLGKAESGQPGLLLAMSPAGG